MSRAYYVASGTVAIGPATTRGLASHNVKIHEIRDWVGRCRSHRGFPLLAIATVEKYLRTAKRKLRFVFGSSDTFASRDNESQP